MKLWAVFKEGVYRHECGGIFSTQELAEACARELAVNEPDNHHSFDVVPFELDEMLPYGAHGPTEKETVFSVSNPLKTKRRGY